jgi:alpha-ketoglutarate-dependent 2,4-dichlorophenoxyacetate dioxygenase
MAVIIYPITPRFAAEISDVDLSCPIGPSDLAAVNEAFAHYAVLIFPDQHLSQDQHLDFARHFGPLETTIARPRQANTLPRTERCALHAQPRTRMGSTINRATATWTARNRPRP